MATCVLSLPACATHTTTCEQEEAEAEAVAEAEEGATTAGDDIATVDSATVASLDKAKAKELEILLGLPQPDIDLAKAVHNKLPKEELEVSHCRSLSPTPA